MKSAIPMAMLLERKVAEEEGQSYQFIEKKEHQILP
jgi:hypothetical protein